MNNLTAVAFPLLFTACFAACEQGCLVSGNVSDSISIHDSVELPAIPSNNLGPAQLPEQDYTFDVSGPLGDLTKAGGLSLTVQHNALSGPDIDAIQTVVVGIMPTDGSLPPVQIAEAGSYKGGDIAVSNMSALIEYLKHGEVKLTITLTVDTSKLSVTTSNLDYDLTLGLDLSVKK